MFKYNLATSLLFGVLLITAISGIAQNAKISQIQWVETTESISVPILSNGKNVGETTIEQGTKLKVRGVKVDKIALEFAGKTFVVPIDKTNFNELKKQQRQAEEKRIAEENDRREEEDRKAQIRAEKLKKVSVDNIETVKTNSGTVIYKSIRDCSFIIKKGATKATDLKAKDFSITPSIVIDDEPRFLLTLRDLVTYKLGGFTHEVEFKERENNEYVTINYAHAERKAIREDTYWGVFDSAVVVNKEQVKKLRRVFSQEVVYFIRTDAQYHRNEYEMSIEQIYAMREMLMKYDEL